MTRRRREGARAADKVEKDDEKAKKDNKDHGFRWPCAKRVRKR